MFNKFFSGNADDLLAMVCTAPTSEIQSVDDPNKLLNRGELIDTVIDEFQVPKEEAERIVTEIQTEELTKICNKMVEMGLVEVNEYDDEGNPKYTPTELGRKLVE